MISEEAPFLCRTLPKYKLLQFLNDILIFYKQEMFDETSVTKMALKQANITLEEQVTLNVSKLPPKASCNVKNFIL